MKAILFTHDEASALELAAAATSLGADELVEVRTGRDSYATAAAIVATVTVPEGAAYEDASTSIAAWFPTQNASLVLASPTRRNKVIVGTLAAKAGATAVSNISAFDGNEVTTRYFGGLADRKVKPTTDTAFYYVPAGMFDQADAADATTVQIPWIEPKASCKVLKRRELTKGQADLTKSEIVISCGRGFSDRDDLDLATSLAEKVGAGIGCTRPLTESVDWFPREAYIGVSGQIIKPRVFIAAGVSGQMQHMVGANTSECIIAVNKDRDAAIFKQCDLGIVGDLKQVLPALTAAL